MSRPDAQAGEALDGWLIVGPGMTALYCYNTFGLTITEAWERQLSRGAVEGGPIAREDRATVRSQLAQRGWRPVPARLVVPPSGQVLSMDHADGRQVVVVHGNTGRAMSPSDPAEQADLDALAMVLRGHGYTVRRPGRTRGEGPLPWGYAAKRPAPDDTEG